MNLRSAIPQSSAERRILALDSEKFDKKSFVKVCQATDVNVVVTDVEPSERWVGFCHENDIELVY